MKKNISDKIQEISGNCSTEHEYWIPRILYNSVKDAVKKNFKTDSTDGRNIRKYNNIMDIALYFPLAILHFNMEKSSSLGNYHFREDDRYEYFIYDFEKGYELSKEIIENVLPYKEGCRIKNFLIDKNIIGKIPVAYKDGIPVYYSPKDKEAIRYRINSCYLDYGDIIRIKNRYADKHRYLLKHNVLFGNTRFQLTEQYLPFTEEEKNRQYRIQKKMEFDRKEFEKIFFEKYPYYNGMSFIFDMIIESPDRFDKQPVIDCRLLYSVNSHIFKCSEYAGRIFMPFQYMSKEFRKAVRYKGMRLHELYDMKCCFLQLACRLFIRDTKNKNEGERLLDEIRKDIYLKFAENLNISRDKIKTSFMWFLFSSKEEKTASCMKIHKNIIDWFSRNFPEFCRWICGYPEKTVKKEGKIKRISKLSDDCFKLESDIMFNHVIPSLRIEYPEVEFISLHDAVWSTEDVKFDFHEKIEKIINNISI